MTARESWGSRLGFIFAAAGSAIGLANIWRFPFLVGAHGGSAFICIYLLCLFLIGFPVFISEIIIGRAGRSSPADSFERLGNSSWWRKAGMLTIITGFIVSAFYSAVAGWILGYLVEAIRGHLVAFNSAEQAASHYEGLIHHPYWALIYHALFLAASLFVLYFGVRGGIERGNKILMPLLFIVLTILAVQGLRMDGGWKGLHFITSPDWSQLTPMAFLIAMGQAFFTLSVGQGTLVTYGSYIKERENLIQSSWPVIAMDTLASLLSAIIVFSIVFSAGITLQSGPGLIFHTLPIAFGQISGGYLISVLFFLAVVLAALTSEISALEPSVAYLVDSRGWSRHHAVMAVGLGAFLLGVPCALSTSALREVTIQGHSILDLMSMLASSILIPFGALFAVVLVGWRWGIQRGMAQLEQGAEELFEKHPLLLWYFKTCIRYVAPLLILVVFVGTLMAVI